MTFFTRVSLLVVALPLLIWINHIPSRGAEKIDNTCAKITLNLQKSPSTSTISLFDEKAYQKALKHKVLDETLCSPVLVLKVSAEKCILVKKGFIEHLDQRPLL